MKRSLSSLQSARVTTQSIDVALDAGGQLQRLAGLRNRRHLREAGEPHDAVVDDLVGRAGGADGQPGNAEIYFDVNRHAPILSPRGARSGS